MKASLKWIIFWCAITAVTLVVFSYYDLETALAHLSTQRFWFGDFVQAWGRKPMTAILVVAAFVLGNKSIRCRTNLLTRMSASICVHVLLHSAVFVNITKLIIGRPRPLNLSPTGEDFVAFFDCNPGLGDFSFPSGHTAIAMSLAPLIYLFYTKKDWRNFTITTLTTILWTGIVAYGRVVYCAHYLTDTVFSIGSSVIFAPISLAIGDFLICWVCGAKASGKCIKNNE
jgi:membrane-associated phospholipid phosphatase